MRGYGLNWSALVWVQMPGSCEHNKEPFKIHKKWELFQVLWGPSSLLWTAQCVKQHVFFTHFAWGKGPLTFFWYKVEETEGGHKYFTTLSSSSVLGVGGWLMPCSGHFNSRKEMSYPLYRGSVGPRACLNGHGKSLALVQIQILDNPVHSQSLCWLHCPGPTLGMVANIWLLDGNRP